MRDVRICTTDFPIASTLLRCSVPALDEFGL